jgi:hypothetical protein
MIRRLLDTYADHYTGKSLTKAGAVRER